MKNNIAFFAILLLLLLPGRYIQAQPAEEKEGIEKTKQTPGSPFSQAKFVPDIAFILDFSLIGRDTGDMRFDRLHTPGLTGAPEKVAHNGFNLNYGELCLHSTVDPYFDLFVNLSATESSLETEEAYFTTRNLPLGIIVKAGKFLSAFGRLNQQHEHCWDFADRPLIHRAVFGAEGLNEKGVQLSLVLPTDTYLMLGGELLQGMNETSYGHDELVLKDENGVVKHTLDGAEGPGMCTGYLKTSFDIGNLVVLGGLSAAHGKSRRQLEERSFIGITTVFGCDLLIKYMIDTYRSISLQGEYLERHSAGREYIYNDTSNDYDSSRDSRVDAGFYSQLIIKFSNRWRAGARLCMITRNDGTDRDIGTRTEHPENLPRYSGMFEFNPTEFSRIRLQFNHDRSGYDGSKRTNINEIIVQFNMAIGAHGAHPL